jgi:hypothetical protein
MKKVLLSLAATLIMVAGFATSADAQRVRGGPGLHRVGGAGFVGGPVGIRRAGIVGGPRWAGGARWAGGPRWWGHRRFARFAGVGLGVGLVGAYPYYAGYGGYGGYGGCYRWRLVPTYVGPQWRLVNLCYYPAYYGGYGGYGGYGYY